MALREGITLINPLVMAGFLMQDLGMRGLAVELCGMNSPAGFDCENVDCPVKKLHVGKGGDVDVICACGLMGGIGFLKQNTRPDVTVSMRGDGEEYNLVSHE